MKIAVAGRRRLSSPCTAWRPYITDSHLHGKLLSYHLHFVSYGLLESATDCKHGLLTFSNRIYISPRDEAATLERLMRSLIEINEAISGTLYGECAASKSWPTNGPSFTFELWPKLITGLTFLETRHLLRITRRLYTVITMPLVSVKYKITPFIYIQSRSFHLYEQPAIQSDYKFSDCLANTHSTHLINKVYEHVSFIFIYPLQNISL